MEADRLMPALLTMELAPLQAVLAAMVLLAVLAAAWRGRRDAKARLEQLDPQLRFLLGLGVEGFTLVLTAFGLGVVLQLLGLIDLGVWLQRIHAVLNFELVSVGGASVTPVGIFTFVVVLLMSLQVSRVVQRGLGTAVRARGIDDEGSIGIAQRLTHYFVVTIGLLLALKIVGVEVSGLFAAGAVFAVGIGFAMQTIAQNFVSGVILLLERTIKPGDVIEVEGRTVRVLEMRIRCTVARTRDEEDLVIPNSTLVAKTVKNLTYNDELIRLRAPVQVERNTDLHEAIEALREAGSRIEGRAPDTDIRVLVTGMDAGILSLEVSIWVLDAWYGPLKRTDLYVAIWDVFRERGIRLAHPQFDVTLRSDAPTAVRLVEVAPDDALPPATEPSPAREVVRADEG